MLEIEKKKTPVGDENLNCVVNIMEYVFETSEEIQERRYFVVICYDIYDNKRRRNFVKFAERYSFRVQRSVFEGELSKSKYEDLISKVQYHIAENDNVRIYRISGSGEVKTWGNVDIQNIDDVIII